MKKDERVGLRLSADLHEKVKALAEQERRSISNMLRVLIEEALIARQERKEEPSGNDVPLRLAA
ncbi:MAG: ribbon-helix-helix protein, CopG family [Chloroflexaceae bacterium]|nr:ribbon-helix-helix protein, CopG family [Chloroflexaceae bacterium]